MIGEMSSLMPDAPLRLLAVMAHPDDESFGVGGTLALYARRDVDVHLICATRGEVGDVEEELLQGYDDIAMLREAELRCAADILGLKEIHFLDYRDSGMSGSKDNRHPNALAAAPLQEVAARVVTIIREIRPQVVITFDPYGGYGHPDHIAIQRACAEAFRAAGDPQSYPDGLTPYQPQKLYYHTFPRGATRMLVRLMPLFGKDPRRFGRNEDIDLVEVAERDFPIHARINISKALEAKQRASACHSSQNAGPGGGFVNWVFRLFGQHEGFMRAHPPVNGRIREKDLFAGVSPE
jgi:LmbE family N-acetylglucosaminyl deacetylase